MFFCAVAGWFINEEKCEQISAVMDGRMTKKGLPLAVTKTVWTQKRCLNCKRHFKKPINSEKNKSVASATLF